MSTLPSSTLPFGGPFDNLLLPFDPTRGLGHWWEHLELHAMADPKVAAARKLLEDKLGSLPEDDVEAVATVFWAIMRRRLRAGTPVSRLCAWLSDGDRVLRTVEIAAGSALTPLALTDLARQVREVELDDSPDTDDLSMAKAEITQFVSSDFGPATILVAGAGFALGAGIAYLALEAEAAIHGHEGFVYHGPH